MSAADAPPLVALFVVAFDQKIGYTITWQESSPGVDLVGVEFKSLPSGVHQIESDEVYFSHGQYVGLTSYTRSASTSEQRNAAFFGVGVLVEPIPDRLGGIWKHVTTLQGLSRDLAHDKSDRALLQKFWTTHRLRRTDKARYSSITSNSDLPLLADELVDTKPDLNEPAESTHPIRAFKEMIRTFRALTFPLHRKALLRRRILLLGHAPVQQMCQYVYIIYLLTLFSQDHLDDLPTSKQVSPYQLLFNIGVADLDQLTHTDAYIACTTDSIIADKTELYDLLVRLPQSRADDSRWPTLFDAAGQQVRATQRDVLRYRAITSSVLPGLLPYSDVDPGTESTDEMDSDSVNAPLISWSESTSVARLGQDDLPADMIEARTWVGRAYKLVLEWTNPDMNEAEELAFDADFDALTRLLKENGTQWETCKEEVTILHFFAQMNVQLLDALQSILEEYSTDSASDQDIVDISPSVLAEMNLDPFSTSDRAFVQDILWSYFERKGRIVDDGITLCGVRVC